MLVGATLGERLVYRDRVLPGVEVDSADLAGDDEREALRELERLETRLARAPVPVRAGGTRLSFEPREVGFSIDTAATVRAARRAGRDGGTIAQVGGMLTRRFGSDTVDLQMSYDDDRLDAVLDRFDTELAAGIQNGAVRIEGTQVVEVPAIPGGGIERPAAKRALRAALRSFERPRRAVEIPVGQVQPPINDTQVAAVADQARRLLSVPYTVTIGTAPLTIAPEQVAGALTVTALGEELVLGVDAAALRLALGDALVPFEATGSDAGFLVNGDTVTLVPAVLGRAVDVQAIADAILREERAITGAVAETQPALTTEAAQALNITEKVSEFTTNYPAGQARVHNIQRAADVVNYSLVRPGETFSLNERLGPRDCARGWVEAPAFATNRGFFQECGGGVSQFSTTLFNATFFGGYEDVEHTPHSIFISRYPMGREATLGYGSIDNKFRNDSGSGVLIITSHTPTSVTVKFFGNREGRTVRAEGPFVLEEIPIGVEYVDNPFLPAGVEQPIEGETGFVGYRVENFRVIERPGQAPVRERFAWTYDMRPRRIHRGTAPG